MGGFAVSVTVPDGIGAHPLTPAPCSPDAMCDTDVAQLSRRRFVALSATVTLAACGSDSTGAPAISGGTAPAPTDPPPTDPAATSTVGPNTTAATTTTTAAPEPDGFEFVEDPFVFGVASGDPDASSVVLWTRLGGELPTSSANPVPIGMEWTYLQDSGGELRGALQTSSIDGYSVHVVVATTEPGTFFFTSGDYTSPEGRTAPIDRNATEFRIAAASCQHYETGHYAAHRDIAEWRPDLVMFLGDFIYEGDPSVDDGSGEVVRSHEGPEPTDLDGYRARYATYLSDPHLQACRAAAPWLAIWDDHEVENNYAGSVSEPDEEPDQDPAVFVARRAAAFQAWWENTPTRLRPPNGTAPFEINRGIDVGNLLRLSAVDGRQFRDDQVSEIILDPGPPVDGWDDPTRTMLGTEQEAWVADRFTSSTAVWNCLAQQTILSDTRLPGGAILNYDQWDGYHAAREQLLADVPANFVTLTGDIHLAGVGRIGPIEAPVGIEFVTTAISSVANVDPALADVVLGIPSIVDANLVNRGYTRHTVTTDAWIAEYRQVADVRDPDSEVSIWKTFKVDADTPDVTEV
jgi:alkaline phosphatase D